MYHVTIIEDDQMQAEAALSMLDRHPRRKELTVNQMASASELKSFLSRPLGGGACN